MNAADMEINVSGNVSQGLAGLQSVQAELGKTIISATKTDSSLALLGKTFASTSTAGKISINSLTANLELLREKMKSATDPVAIARYSSDIQTTTQRIKELSLSGYDATEKLNALGRAMDRATNPTMIAAREVNNFSRRLISLGGGFVFGALAEGASLLVEALSHLGDKSGGISTAASNLQNLNEVMADANKNAGGQVADLKILYQAATDVNLSMKDRLAAVKELKKEFPDYFASISNEAILNGQAEKSYIKLTASIIDNAKAKAVKDKLDELEAKKLDNEYQRAKIIGTTEAEATRAKTRDLNAAGSSSFDIDAVGSNQVLTREAQIAAINERKKKALELVDINNKSLSDQEDFLTKFAGLNKLEEQVIKENTGKGTKHTKKVETIAGDLEKLREQITLLSQEEIILKTDKAKEKISDIENTIKHLVEKFHLSPDSQIILNLEAQVNAIKLSESLKAWAKAENTDKEKNKIIIPYEFQIANLESLEREAKAIKNAFAPAQQSDPKQGGLTINPFANEGDALIGDMMRKLSAAGVRKGLQDGMKIGVEGLRFPQLTDLSKSVVAELKQLTSLIKNTLAGVFESLGESLGKALAGGGNFLTEALGGIFHIMGEFLIQLGKAAIMTSALFTAIKASKVNPITGIIGGIAAIAAGAILENIKLPAFATGVNNFAGGYALVGERGPEIVNLPSGSDVLPNSRLNAMGSSQTAPPDVVIRGQDLVLVYNRAVGRLNRNS